jgi:hypothetical protein
MDGRKGEVADGYTLEVPEFAVLTVLSAASFHGGNTRT